MREDGSAAGIGESGLAGAPLLQASPPRMSQVVVRGQGNIAKLVFSDQGVGAFVVETGSHDSVEQASDHQHRHARRRENCPACGGKRGTKQRRVERCRFQDPTLMTLTTLLQVLEQGHGDFLA